MHYLDNAATTLVAPQVADVVDATLRTQWANPSSLYAPGMQAEDVIGHARLAVARALGHRGNLDVRRPEVVFTASGTEANNIAILGAARARRARGNHIVATGYEHPSAEGPLKLLEKEGFSVTWVNPGADGRVDPSALTDAVEKDTVLLCAMCLNNETGAVLDVAALAKKAKEKNGRIAVHVDGVQAFTKIDLAPALAVGVDTVALSGHKIHAPKGVGALYVKAGFALEAPFAGGGQESGLRPGTENTAYIAGFAKAAELAMENRQAAAATIKKLQQRLLCGLSKIDGVIINSPADAWPGIVNFSLPGIRSETMLHHLERAGVYVSGGSACGRGQPSHTLTAMGLPKQQVESALRVSFCAGNTPADVDALLAGLASGAATLARG